MKIKLLNPYIYVVWPVYKVPSFQISWKMRKRIEQNCIKHRQSAKHLKLKQYLHSFTQSIKNLTYWSELLIDLPWLN